jgi:ferredoxin
MSLNFQFPTSRFRLDFRARSVGCFLWFLAIGLSAGLLQAAERFPPPDFTSGYQLPTDNFPDGVAVWREWGDVFILAGFLGLASWLAIKRRSRALTLALAVVSLLYFGFYRRGCVCVIGSTQNVSVALANPEVILPLSLLAFFLLPLVFALFFGRVFCSAVCPQGAIQEAVLIRPVRLPEWLARPLEWLPFLTLVLGILTAATGCGFMICRHDPFIGLFRLGGPRVILALGFLFVGLSTFIGRPYCRFACPYGALLRLISPLAWRPLTITPDECIRCGLCAEACPYGAIIAPVPEDAARDRQTGKATLRWILLAFPLLLIAGGGLGYLSGPALARLNPEVRMADYDRARQSLIPDRNLPERLAIYRQAGGGVADLQQRAGFVVQRVRWGAVAGGLFMAGIIGFSLMGVVVRRAQPDWRADPARCVACGRCVRYCPREHRRLRAAGVPTKGMPT